MLHILFLILKIAGIILAVILGIVVLLACIVLFVPVRYEILGKCGGDIKSLKSRVCVTWLLRLVRLDIYYKEQKLKWRIRILWIKKTGGQIKEEESGYEESNTKERKSEETGFEEASEISESKEEVSEESHAVPEKPEGGREEGEKSMEEIPETESGDAEASEVAAEPEEPSEEGTGLPGKIWGFLHRIAEKIRELKEKKDRILEFLRDETHIGAFRKGKKELFRLLRRLKPKKLLLEARFGFSDPCTTGQVLAGLSILYPVLGDSLAVTPDFENRVLKGRAEICGRIYACHFLILCWNVIWCRNVRRTYTDVKNFEL